MVLNNGLVVIDEFAFTYSSSLECIVVPPTVMEIDDGAFSECMQLSLVILKNELEMIGSNAFEGTSIKSIKTPLSVTENLDDAFEHFSNLTHVVFCDMIKRIVSRMLMKYWRNQGVHEKSLSTYCFLIQCNIPMSMKNLTQNMWHINIHHMLQHIPSIANDNLHSYFDSISKKLQLYNTLKDVPALLELVMWKLMIITDFDENDIFDILSAGDKIQMSR